MKMLTKKKISFLQEHCPNALMHNNWDRSALGYRSLLAFFSRKWKKKAQFPVQELTPDFKIFLLRNTGFMSKEMCFS